MLTGREARTLPPAVVRGLFWRISVAGLWDGDVIRASRTPLPKQATAAEAGAHIRLTKVAKLMETVAFPEDDDG